MNTSIVPIKHPLLGAYLQYFIFFDHDLSRPFSYHTFPNTNLCLTIYRNNRIEYKRNKNMNHCIVSGGENTFSSRLFGFHDQPFKVDVNNTLDQICILFHPVGLRAFTRVPYVELLGQPDAFECIFGNQTFILEEIFECSDRQGRADLIEAFLLKRLLVAGIDPRTQLSLGFIYKTKGNISVRELSVALKLNESTLYRFFRENLGQGPKDFIQTVRFRNVLKLFLEQENINLTELAHKTMFYDQSHFIKDFKIRSGSLPNEFRHSISLEQRLLAWVKNP
ncbi:MAG: AraC family transcriptional regulator [Chryseobacterium sp.]|nr:MAG: AraC family transcriptional regulator [Chryseobacterium sp.]